MKKIFSMINYIPLAWKLSAQLPETYIFLIK